MEEFDIRSAVIGICVGAGFIGSFVLGQYLRFGGEFALVQPTRFVVDYNDLIVLLLTCIAVLLTILGIGIALLTVFGVRSVKVLATKQAFAAAKAELENEESAISKKILKIAESSAYSGIEKINIDDEQAKGEFD